MTVAADSSLLAVLKDLQTTIQSIKGQVNANGFNYFNTIDDDCVVTNGVPLATVLKRPFVIVGHRIDPKGRETTGLTATAVKETWGFVLEGRVDAAAADALGRVTAFAQIIADLEVAIRQDITRGGKALYTVLGQATPYFGSANDTAVYFEQPVDVTLRRVYGVP